MNTVKKTTMKWTDVLDTSTNYNKEVRHNDKYGKPTDSATQGLTTSNPVNDKITRGRGN